MYEAVLRCVLNIRIERGLLRNQYPDGAAAPGADSASADSAADTAPGADDRAHSGADRRADPDVVLRPLQLLET